VAIRKTIPSNAILDAIERISEEIATRHSSDEKLVLAGIANGGIPLSDLLAASLQQRLSVPIHKAVIDISFHRDDIGSNPIAKPVESTELAADPEDAVIILVDDVLFSGRSVRAAMAEVHAIGRPKKIELAVLVDRGNRLLPVAADYIGIEESTTPAEKVDVHINVDHSDQSRIDILAP